MIEIKDDTFDSLPIGTIINVYLPFVNIISEYWADCNGSTISDSESPLNGQTLPNLNDSNLYLRGNSSSGSTGGTNSNHSHTIPWPVDGGDGTGSNWSLLSSASNGTTSHQPPYQEVKYYMRIK